MEKQNVETAAQGNEQVLEVNEMTKQIIEELSAQVEALKGENETLKGVLKEARPATENGKKTKGELPEPFEVDGKIIKITKRAFMFNGQKVTADDLKNNTEIITKLLEIKSKVLEIVSQ